jgi:hypothetical protein
VWHPKHRVPEPPPAKEIPWQIWQERNPEGPGASLAAAPWTTGVFQPQRGPWWHPAAFAKQELPEIPPERSAPWHSTQELCSPESMKSIVAIRACSPPVGRTSQPSTDWPAASVWIIGSPGPSGDLPEEQPAASAAKRNSVAIGTGDLGNRLFRSVGIVRSSYRWHCRHCMLFRFPWHRKQEPGSMRPSTRWAKR